MDIVSAGKIAGLILAHTALIGSDQEGVPIAPYAIFESGENREVINYPADSQAEAVETMQAEIQKYQDTVSAWASAQEGYISNNDEQSDIYLIKIWVPGVTEPIKFYQEFNPQPFKLKGNIKILNFEDAGFSLEDGELFHSSLDEGISSHPSASDKWESWF